MKKKDTNPMELSYYRLSLLSFLKESHPTLATDTDFIKTRADEAAEAYSDAVKGGLSHIEAEELANLTLFQGLLFSRHDTIVHVLWNEFADVVPQSEAADYAKKLLSPCEPVFSQYLLPYVLFDEFMYSPEYNMLYTELTGCIDLWLEENGVQ